MSFEIAISAPVLPADTAACASPAFTASSAIHMLEPFARRSAWLGFSCMETTWSVCTMRDLAPSAGWAASAALMRASLP